VTQAQPCNTAVQYQILTPGEVDLGRAGHVLEFWENCRGTAFAPRWGSDFRLSDLPTDILPNVSVVDVIDGGERYYYRFWGTNNVTIKGFEMSQKYLDQSPVESVRRNGYHQFGVMVRERRPLVFLYEAVYRDKINVGCVTLRLPLSSDGVTVDKIASYQDLNMRRNAWQNLFDTLRQQPMSTAP
jgi:hypothetical protein